MSEYTLPARLDAVTAPETEEKLLQLIAREKPEQLTCNFSETDYVSSAGLRVMLVVTKRMQKTGGKFLLKGMLAGVYDIFKLAGFHTVLNIEAPEGSK